MKQIRIIIITLIAVAAVFFFVKTQFKTDIKPADPVSSNTSVNSKTSEAVSDFNQLPVKGMVTMIDLGATECIPCKMMAPILKKLEAAYKGKAVIVFIDVWLHKEQASRFGIRAIPTQIFFDASGKEVYRHVGFMDEKAIIDRLTQMGVENPVL